MIVLQCYGSDIHNPLYILRIMDVFLPLKQIKWYQSKGDLKIYGKLFI